MSSSRRILFISGNRADFDYLAPILRACASLPDIEPRLLLTGSHLSALHGLTERYVLQEGFTVHHRVENLLLGAHPGSRARSMALCQLGIVDAIQRDSPDAVFALGDREEVLAAGSACVYSRVPFVHYGAGDEAFDGNVDNPVRHAASKLACLHLTYHPLHNRMLVAQGEALATVHHVGSTSVEAMLTIPSMSEEELHLALPFALPPRPRALVVFHPTLTSHETAGAQMTEVLQAIHREGVRGVVGFPNSDAGSAGVRAAIEQGMSQLGLVTYHHLPRHLFVNLLRHVDLLIGNSSMGILEAPSLGLPVINVGERQRSRLRASNVIAVDVDGSAIQQAIGLALSPAFRERAAGCNNPYATTDCARKIASLLASAPLNASKTFPHLSSIFQDTSHVSS